MGIIPMLGARLAQLTFEPGLLVTDGEATLLAPVPDGSTGHHGRITEGWIPLPGRVHDASRPGSGTS